MAKLTSNKSIRPDDPIKALRRAQLTDGETDDRRRVPGANGTRAHGPRRPGRAAALRTSARGTRSQRWRTVASGKLKRRANPAQHTRRSRRPKG